ncbi:hypothetical protein ABPG75_006421 [Micractinium tetrahymenae]
MGRPLPRACAAPGCTRVQGCEGTQGLLFSAAECFSKPLTDAPQLWACCLQHKRESLFSILRDLPYRQSKRSEQHPARR